MLKSVETSRLAPTAVYWQSANTSSKFGDADENVVNPGGIPTGLSDADADANNDVELGILPTSTLSLSLSSLAIVECDTSKLKSVEENGYRIT